MRDDPFDLDRFVQAQEGDYEQALAEITSGRKRTHWMWYVFPQIDGLALARPRSATRSRVSTRPGRTWITRSSGRGCWSAPRRSSASRAGPRTEIFGSPDDLKLRSCATLFACVSPPGSVFDRLLDKYYGGGRRETLGLLESDR